MKTAVIYARYSSDKQTEQSIEGQVRVCQDYAKRNDIVIVDEYIDRAVTATNDNRDRFQDMIKDSAKRQWDYVLVYKLDRFSRNQYETIIHKKTLNDNGVRLISVMENIPDTPEGGLMETVIIGFNQYFSEELRQKVNRGLRESWLKGNYTIGRRLYGYNVVDKKLVINEHEKNIILRIFNQYAQGFNVREITETLNALGYHRPQGQDFTEAYIFKMLHNARYTGTVTLQGEVYDKIYPRIIDENLWQKVSAIYEINKHAPSQTKAKFNYFLSGKLICGLCNHRMFGDSGTGQNNEIHRYYSCRKNRKHKTCQTKSISKELLEDMIIKAIQNTLYNPENIEYIAKKMFDFFQQKNKNNQPLNILEQQKREIIKSIQNIVKAIEQGITSEFTQSRLNELESELADIDNKINKEKHRICSDLTIESMTEFIKSKLFGKLNNERARRILINSLIKEIRLYPDKIIIIFRISDNTPPNDNKLTLEDNIKTEGLIKSALYNQLGSNIIPFGVPSIYNYTN